MPCGTGKGTYYVRKDVGRKEHHYVQAKYKGSRGSGQHVSSKLKKYK